MIPHSTLHVLRTSVTIAVTILSVMNMTKIHAFTATPSSLARRSVSLVSLQATGKGFGKPSNSAKSTDKNKISSNGDSSSAPTDNVVIVGDNSSQQQQQFLTSIEGVEDTTTVKPSLDLDPSLTPDERQEMILRKQFGLTKPGENEGSAWVPQSQRNIPEPEKDLFSMIPAPVLIAIDRLLKAGLAICTSAFMGAGVLITLEAWQHASGDSSLITSELDEFIVNIIEPNFTPGLLVLLGFSVTLGVFTIASGGSASSQYRE